MIDINEITPIEKRGSIWFKRDDLFNIDGYSGAKVRACYALCQEAVNSGYNSIVSCGFRYSPQLAIVGAIAKRLNLNSKGFTSTGEHTSFLKQAISNGVDLEQVSCGYSGVLKSRAKKYAEENNAFIVPQAMESELAIGLVRNQFIASFNNDSPLRGIKRVVVATGSGTNLSGVLEGMKAVDFYVPVLSVIVGHDCSKSIYKRFAGDRVLDELSFVTPKIKYLDDSLYNRINGITVDSRYEGKAITYLRGGDLFWLIGFFNHSTVSVGKSI